MLAFGEQHEQALIAKASRDKRSDKGPRWFGWRLTSLRFVNRLWQDRKPIASLTKPKVWLWSTANRDGAKLSTLFDFVNHVIALGSNKTAEPSTIRWIYGALTNQKSKGVLSTSLILEEIRFKLLYGSRLVTKLDR